MRQPMKLRDRLRATRSAEPGRHSLARDARAMRAALDALYRDRSDHGGVDLRGLVRDLLEGEVQAPTADVAELQRRGTDPERFYESEVAPSWEGRGEAERAERIGTFLEMCMRLDAPGGPDGISPEMAASVRTRTLLLAWAFDETYGYLSSLGRTGGPV
jgi:hypothetical protein